MIKALPKRIESYEPAVRNAEIAEVRGVFLSMWNKLSIAEQQKANELELDSQQQHDLKLINAVIIELCQLGKTPQIESEIQVRALRENLYGPTLQARVTTAVLKDIDGKDVQVGILEKNDGNISLSVASLVTEGESQRAIDRTVLEFNRENGDLSKGYVLGVDVFAIGGFNIPESKVHSVK